MSKGKPGELWKRRQRSYLASTKEQAVRRVRAGEAVGPVASDLGVPAQRVYYWLDRSRSDSEFWAGRRRRRSKPPPEPGSREREAALERLLGQKQLELDFFRQALRCIEEARRPHAGRSVLPSTGSSQPGRKAGKAD